MQRKVVHAVALVTVKPVGFLFAFIVTGRWAHLKGVETAARAAHGVDPVAAEVVTEVFVLTFRIYDKDFCAFHVLAHQDMLDGRGLTYA